MVPASSGPVRLADYPVSAVYGPRRLVDYEFVWILRGSAVWRITEDAAAGMPAAAQEHVLRPGTLALARPGTTDSYRWDAERPSTHAYVHFQLAEGPALTGCDDHQGWPVIRSMALLPVLDGSCRYLLQLAGDPSADAAARRDELISLMVDIFVHGPLPAAEPELPHFMIAVADRVRADWDSRGIRPIGVESLASSVGLSAGHLHRLFRDHVGLGPGHALELVRLSRAAEALQRSNASIAEIAELTGFANPYHFSRRFRRAYGQPPGMYRQAEHHLDPLAPLQDRNLLALSYRLG
jgi:AraC-like DNA-binding protein